MSMSRADWYRFARSFSSALRMMTCSFSGMLGFRSRGGTGDFSMIALRITASVVPGNAISPTAMS